MTCSNPKSPRLCCLGHTQPVRTFEYARAHAFYMYLAFLLYVSLIYSAFLSHLRLRSRSRPRPHSYTVTQFAACRLKTSRHSQHCSGTGADCSFPARRLRTSRRLPHAHSSPSSTCLAAASCTMSRSAPVLREPSASVWALGLWRLCGLSAFGVCVGSQHTCRGILAFARRSARVRALCTWLSHDACGQLHVIWGVVVVCCCRCWPLRR